MAVNMDFASKSSVLGISLKGCYFPNRQDALTGGQGPSKIEGHNHVHFKRNGSVEFDQGDVPLTVLYKWEYNLPTLYLSYKFIKFYFFKI